MPSSSVRLRDFGIAIGRFDTGPNNAITDVAGVRVGHSTIIRGEGPRVVGEGPVRTGVTVVQPRAGLARDVPCFAGAYTLNGNGECTGLEWLREAGVLTTAIGLTNTHSVGVVRDALVADDCAQAKDQRFWSMPVVGETYDGQLSDITGQHVTAEHVRAALADASPGPVVEGAVGGGTGMICHEFKGGIGTSSRIVADAGVGPYVVAALVQANYGRREDLRIHGVPVGRAVPRDVVPSPFAEARAPLPPGSGSIIVVLATDAPLLPDQCRRLAERATVGLARVGGGCSDSSGDIFFAFATGIDVPPEYYYDGATAPFDARLLPHQAMTPLFEGAADATEEAILNALVAAETTTGADGVTAYALPHDVIERAARVEFG